ncbi:Sulfite exporter TauE/SafE (plasmid) [Piscirickettsia salmonis]|uniref:TSUP family transporter n=1 Tax=Piscirickettsia salmonis TaxID=1238 RepID=UPI0012B769CC|nr:TSUP family transporter [Piscirickettsia salmonis]QGO78695.1 Sulfite exporter TauE/SafE [Piscirickettsia salmonis]
MILVPYIVAGVFTGILSGWVGAGGGIVIVPVMLWLAAQQGINTTLAMHLAVTTSLGFIMVNSLYTTFHHYRSNNLVRLCCIAQKVINSGGLPTLLLH